MLRRRDIMTTEVVTLSPEVSLRDVRDVFVARHISGAPGVGGTPVMGVITSTDLLTIAASLPGVPSEPPEGDLEWSAWAEPAPTAEHEKEGDEGDKPPATFFREHRDGRQRAISRGERPERHVLEEHPVAEAMHPSIGS